jgi:hypothetical protein
MSSIESPAPDRKSAVDTVAGLMSAAALLFSLVAIAYHPITISVASVTLALVGAGLSARYRRLAAAAVYVSALCFVVGISIAVITHNPLW